LLFCLSDQICLCLDCQFICIGHAIRKAASEITKKQSGVEKHQSVQKRRLNNSKDDIAPLPSSSVRVPFYPSMNYDIMSNMDRALGTIGADMGVEATNASFLSSLDAGSPSVSTSSALHSSLSAANTDVSNTLAAYLPYGQADMLSRKRDYSGETATAAVAAGRQFDWGMLYGGAASGVQSSFMGLDGSDDPTLLQSIQRRQLLMGAAQKQQEAMAMLRKSNEMTRLAQTSGASAQGQIDTSAMGAYGAAFGDMSYQDRIAVFAAAASAQNTGNRMVPSTFDPQAMRVASHLASGTSPIGSFLTQSNDSAQLQLARMTDSDHRFLPTTNDQLLGKNGSDKVEPSESDRVRDTQ
jgi:hypothetical protein